MENETAKWSAALSDCIGDDAAMRSTDSDASSGATSGAEPSQVKGQRPIYTGWEANVWKCPN